jgi:hypothetical protein
MHKNSISRKINNLVSRAAPGNVLTTHDVMRFGSRAAADNTLSRLVKAGRLARLGPGMYYVPKVSRRLGPLSPSTDQIARAMGRRTGCVVQPIGAAAANALGLSSQVPARAVYITNGKSRRRRIGSAVIELRHAAPKTLAGAGTKAGSVLHALRYLGKRGVTSDVLTRLNSQLTDADRRQLRKLIPSAPAWMHPTLKTLTSPLDQSNEPSEAE